MSRTTSQKPPRSTRSYRLRVTGRLDAGRAAWFDGFVLTNGGDGTTTISGPVTDQAQLHGLLAKIRDLGITLLSVEADPQDAGATPASSGACSGRGLASAV
ncbi:MAG: hypothetical protein ACOH1Y_04060 [Propionicimonas sp.]